MPLDLRRLATSAQRRADAEYHTRARKSRCDQCENVCASTLATATRSDRYCSELQVTVKTHGTCKHHSADLDADLPATEFPDRGCDPLAALDTLDF